MAILTVYLLNTAASAPNWFGRVQDNGSAPAGALSAFGWTVAKVALTTPYWRGRIGATARATVATVGSYIDAATGPVQGTGAGATTAGDSFRSDNALTGTFTAGNWNFTFGMRTGAASNSGRVRCLMWASANADGSGARKLTSATLVGTAVTMSTATTTYNSTVTWAAPQIVLNNEYLFLQVEWQSTVVGTSNSCTAQFYQASFVATNFAQVFPFTGIGETTEPPVLGEPVFGQKHVIGTSLPTLAGAPEFEAPDFAEVVLAGTDDLVADGLTTSLPSVGGATFGQECKLTATALAVLPPLTIQSSALGQAHKFIATPLAVQPPTCDAATVVIAAIPLVASNLVGAPASFGTPAMLPIILLSPSNLATAPPVEAAATFGQKHVIVATAFAPTSSPTVPAASFAQPHTLAAIASTISNPTIGASALGQAYALTASALATGKPVFDVGVLGQAGVMAAIPAAAGVPVFAVGSLRQTHTLAATSLATGATPTVAAVLGQSHALIPLTLAASVPGIGTGALGQKHGLTAAAFATAPSVAGVAVMSQAGVMAAIPPIISPPIIGVPTFGQKHFTVAQSLAAGAPALGVPALGKVLSATAITVSPPVLGAPALTKVLAATSLGTNAPVLAAPACALRVFGLAASGLAIGSPALPALAIGQSGVMAAVPVGAGAPVQGAPVLTQRHVLSAVGASAGAPIVNQGNFGQRITLVAFAPQVTPAIGAPALGQRHSLATTKLDVGASVIGVGILGQAGVMAAVPLWPQPPVFPVLVLHQSHRFIGNGVAVSPPWFEAPEYRVRISLPRPQNTFAGRFRPLPAVLGQAHQLNAQAVTVRAPRVPVATFFEGETFGAIPLEGLEPYLGTPVLGVVSRVSAVGLAPRPALGRAELSQVHRLGARDLSAGRPALWRPRLSELRDLDAIGISVEVPAIAVPALVVRDRLLSFALVTSRPRRPLVTGSSTGQFGLSTGRPVIGRRSSGGGFTGQRDSGVSITGRRAKL